MFARALTPMEKMATKKCETSVTEEKGREKKRYKSLNERKNGRTGDRKKDEETQ